MDIFSGIEFESRILYLKIKNQAEEIFGYASSFIKTAWIIQEYQKEGGLIIAPEKLADKDYQFIKGELRVSFSNLGRKSVTKELRYCESFINDESLSNIAIDCTEKIEKLLDQGLSKKAFQELYESTVSPK